MSYMNIDRTYLLADMKRLACEVIFDKVNGQRRVMRCTLNPLFMPEGTDPNVVQSRTGPIVAWDIEKSGWRSFHTNRIVSVQQVNTA